MEEVACGLGTTSFAKSEQLWTVFCCRDKCFSLLPLSFPAGVVRSICRERPAIP